MSRSMTDDSPPATPPPTSRCPTTPAPRSRCRTSAGRKVIVYFYPAAMTPGCTKQACDFSDSLDSLARRRLRGARHLPRQAGEARQVPRARSPSTSPLLSDADKSVMAAYGAYGEKKLYGKTVRASSAPRSSSTRTARSSVAQYNVKATGHVAKLRKDLGPRRLKQAPHTHSLAA